MQYLYNVFQAAKNNQGRMSANAHIVVDKKRIGIKEFGNFIKFFDKDINEQQSQDIFMLLSKKLAIMLIGTKPAEDEFDMSMTQD